MSKFVLSYMQSSNAEGSDFMSAKSHEHAHHHTHDPQSKKRQMNRISRMVGHLEHVKKMIDNDEDCAQVLIQLSAIRSAMNGLGIVIYRCYSFLERNS